MTKSVPSMSPVPPVPPVPGRLTFVTGNPGKLRELQAQLAPLGIEVVQDDRGYPEVQADTLAEVAEAGARHLLATGLAPPFLLEDSGLFVAALRGFPGVYSRHALDTIGLGGVLKLLSDVEGEMRTAAFQAHLLYVDAAGGMHGFAGTCPGRIAGRPAGSGGFGFDPIFQPRGDDRTFAEMDAAQKAALGHRGKAVRAFLEFVEKSTKA
ncbi:MAG TPA: RdgB/HAM1 family non-canonical purine NTP pyrophosphatase [Candidatus Thermoplasmatota archaeon]|nr:RdgB/HAM1 family non-canonical purine NTP pyrophosphatase [Candidatus Thermoplasmatota archaeon]